MTEKDTPCGGGKTRESMPFPFRWRKSLLKLPDGELRTMLTALLDYGETRTAPEFSGATAALWEEFADRIDHDFEQYSVTCRRNRENGRLGAEYGKMGGRPKKNPEKFEKPPKTPTGVSETPKTPEGEGDGEGDGEDNIIEASKDRSLSASSPKPFRHGASGTKNPSGKIFFDYHGDSRLHGVTAEQLALWSELFPALDVENELRKASAWLDGHRKNRKYDVKKFLSNWLGRAQENAPPDRAPAYRGRPPVDFDRVNAEVERMRKSGYSAWEECDENGQEIPK